MELYMYYSLSGFHGIDIDYTNMLILPQISTVIIVCSDYTEPN